MHDTALAIAQKFFELYVTTPGAVIVEIGAMNVNGSARSVCREDAVYLGLDYEHGPGVDIIVKLGEPLPMRAEFGDVVISSSQMEHDPFFWRTFLEMLRVLKPGGLIYLNVPSNGTFHRYPKDYWRFYPDSGVALQEWGRANGIDVTLVESFIANRRDDIWNDFVAVFSKKAAIAPEEIGHLGAHFASSNAQLFGTENMQRMEAVPEDQRIIQNLRAAITTLEDKIRLLTIEVEALRAQSTLAEPVAAKTPAQESDERAG